MSPPRQRILVVEDDPEIRYLLGAILEGEDRDVGCATTGAEALGALEDGAVDVVVLDLILPDVDGRTLLSRIRDSARTAATEVVVVTARTGPEVRQECYALGADAFVEKPFDPEALVAEVSNRLERAARAGAAASRDPLTGLLNRAGLRERCETAGSAGYGLGVLEIDRFGVRSEGWGWDASERVVAAVAEALSAGVAGEVELARLGGGGFALFVAAADEAAITRAADEALAAVRGLDLEPLVGDADPLTGTIGVAAAAAGTPLEEAL
ncbi:MAG TPA: response regulator, partial [Longimicrobiales bacterium]|nr:response regulator [Longimicrobiales bacterium]